MTRKRWIVITVLVLLFAGGAAAVWRYTHPPIDPQVAAVAALQRQLFQDLLGDDGRAGPAAAGSGLASAGGAPVPPQTSEQAQAQRRALFEQLREQMENLSEEQRRQVMENRAEIFRSRMRARIEEFYALPDDQKVAFLDREIDRWEDRRRSFQTGSSGRGGGRSDRGQRRDRPERTDEDRQQRRRDRVGNSSALERAQFANYMEQLNNRREERGLEPFNPWRR